MQRSVKYISGRLGIAVVAGLAMFMSGGCSQASKGTMSNMTPTQMNQSMQKSAQNYAAYRQAHAQGQATGQPGQ